MKKQALGLIRLYNIAKPLRRVVLGTIFMGDRTCRFYPTCSDYTAQAINKYGLLKGSVMGFWRLLRCQPFSKGGLDPVK